MSARLPRRSFATPFVVTLAGLGASACYVQPAPRTPGGANEVVQGGPASPPPLQPTDPATPPPTQPTQPTGPSNTTIVSNPPRPTAPATQTPPVSVTTPPVNTTPVPTATPSPTAVSDRRWTVSKQKGVCKAYITPNCPTAPKGQPQPTCNPPPPTAYTCTKNLADGESMKVVQYGGAGDCMIDFGPMQCPPNAICNPPPPTKVACPK